MASTKYRAYLCCGRNCGPKGSGALLDFLAAEVARLGIDNEVSVLPTGCQSHCESGPTMVVYPGPVYYQEIDQQRLARIASRHLRDDVPVEEYFWRGEPLRIRPAPVKPYGPAYRDAQVQPYTRSGGQDPKPKKNARREDVDDFKW